MILDGLYYGDLTVKDTRQKLVMEFLTNLVNWVNLRSDKQGNNSEFTRLRDQISKDFFALRFAGLISGVMQDRSSEIKIKKLEADNTKFKLDIKKMRESLNQSYIPPKDSNVGTA